MIRLSTLVRGILQDVAERMCEDKEPWDTVISCKQRPSAGAPSVTHITAETLPTVSVGERGSVGGNKRGEAEAVASCATGEDNPLHAAGNREKPGAVAVAVQK